MSKQKFNDINGVKNLMYPYLPVLVGATVGGKPNFITIGLVGWLCYDAVSVSLGHGQYTTPGIKENGTFSINQPGANLVRELDYCGIHSGRYTEKAALFEIFYGETKTAPMIAECPLNLECRVIQILKRKVHTVFIGEVVGVYVDDEILTEGVPDVEKLDPVFYAPRKKRGAYWRLGEYLAPAWEIGRELKP